jgi:hypothetical protein
MLTLHDRFRGAAAFSDALDGPPSGDRRTQWILGVFFSLVASIASIATAFTYHWWPGTFGFFFACFLHFHYFWGLTEKWVGVSDIGKNVAALGMILLIGYVGCLWFVNFF